MNKAAFSLEKYTFEKVDIDLSKSISKNIEIDFAPSGKYILADKEFHLCFTFLCKDKENDNQFIEIRCIGIFKFTDLESFDEIPSYFYRNSIAILFPFVRAFVSTVTLQANISPILLPTMNLSSLEEPLKQNTKII